MGMAITRPVRIRKVKNRLIAKLSRSPELGMSCSLLWLVIVNCVANNQHNNKYNPRSINCAEYSSY